MIFDECFKLCSTYFAVLSVILLFPSVLFLNIAVYRHVCGVECILCNSLHRITCAVKCNFIGQEFIMWACGAYGGGERCVQGSGWEA
jgi:hypothetical protein